MTDLELALEIADAADAITMRHFQSEVLGVRTKSDRTPVSEADEAVEVMVRQRLAAARPDDGIVGEEQGVTGSSDRRWILDPIDATNNYIRGIPIFATLLGLEVAGRVEVGVVSAPAMGKRWWAARGEGAYGNGRRLRVSRPERIEDSHLSYDDFAGFEKYGWAEAYLELARRCTRTRGFGDFWSFMLVAEGAIEIAAEPRVAIWDMAAVQPIVEEAGGTFSSLTGEHRIDGGSGLATNGPIHEAVLDVFRRGTRA